MLEDRRLFLVSNREPYVRKDRGDGDGERMVRTTGGLVTALDPVMRRSGGVWIAWEPGGEPGSTRRQQVPETGPGFTLRQVPLTTGEVRRYYYGFANRALWPLCHYFIDRCRFAEDEWRQYVRINERFADAVAEETRADDLIWIHDYHFCLLPEMVRERRDGQGRIAFFLHIPFPTEEVFKILPWRRKVLAGLLGADVVGFHVASYAGHFLGCCERILGAEVDHERRLVHWQGRVVQVGSFPIGIDVAEFESIARAPETEERAADLRRDLGDARLILGVDRLDYSKGILDRLHTIEAFLEQYPEERGRFVFVQVAVPSRTLVAEYRELKRSIDEKVGSINGRFGDSQWQPVRYVYRGLPRPELIAHYRAADVCLVTPLRDGMNLVALEYCASRVDGDGALVLSEFTGAAQVLGPQALLVNPFAAHRSAEILHQALEMPTEERQRRMKALRRRVAGCDVNDWLADVLRAALREQPPSPAPH
jgi:alpha,alpha-trehalose-phosphate synthase [UDP-forming]